MTLTTGRAQLCVYRRSGFGDMLLHLCADGTTWNPPGHAEVHWALGDSDEQFRFSTADRACTARLAWDGTRYNGVLLDCMDASLEPYRGKEIATDPWVGTEADARRELTIITIADSFMPGFLRLWDSCRHWDITPLVLGFGSTFRGLTSKIHLLYRALIALEGTLRTVAFLDGFDTLVVAPPSEIMRAFREFGRPLVFSAERNCAPEWNRAPSYPNASTPYRFLNAGAFIGEASHLLSLLAKWDAIRWPIEANDQLVMTDAFLADTSALVLDHECRLFQSMFWSEGDVEVDEQGIRNRITGARPLIVHANGRSDMSKAVEWFDRMKIAEVRPF